MALRPLVFVAMPFGKKLDPTARVEIDFDEIYRGAIVPAAEAANLDVIRADEEIEGGLIHLGMFERLLLAEIVVADLTSLNANVFYELGIRHAARPRTTIPIFARITRLPFDQVPIRAVPYDLVGGALTDKEGERLKGELTRRLERASDESERHDSPLFQLVKDYRGIELAHEVTESFRDRVRQVAEIRDRIAALRGKVDRLTALHEIEAELQPFANTPAELLLDLLLAYRSVEAWPDMVRFVEALPEAIRSHVTVREQLAQALGRRNKGHDRQRAISVLRDVQATFGPSAETSGLLGGIYKREYEDWLDAGETTDARAALDAAIDAYTDGVSADPRDAYPGINLLTLLTRRDGPRDRESIENIAPVVAFALARRGVDQSDDYWDVATALELAVLRGTWPAAQRCQGRLSLVRSEPWMFKTTADNLQIIAEAFVARDGKTPEELDGIIAALRERAT
jgi:hypothetical protein